MKALSSAFLALVTVLLFAPSAQAQVASAVVVSSCGTPPQTYSTGTIQPTTQDSTGKQCSNSTATISSNVTANLSAATTGGCPSQFHISGGSAASNNATNVKNGAGTLCAVTLINTTATLAYFRMYNSSSSPTCSSATGVSISWPVPASSTGAGVSVNLGPFGLNFSTGISFCLTGGGSDTDNTNAPAGVYVSLIYD